VLLAVGSAGRGPGSGVCRTAGAPWRTGPCARRALLREPAALRCDLPLRHFGR